MITKITNLRELPYSNFTGHLLKSEEDANKYNSGWLFHSQVLDMIILFVEYIEEFDDKMVRNN